MKKFLEHINEVDRQFSLKLHLFDRNLIMKMISHLGNFITIAVYLILFFCLPVFLFKSLALFSFISFLINTVIVFVLKYTLRRKRHKMDTSMPVVHRFDPYSFPSGHIARLAGLIVPAVTILPLFFVLIILTPIVAIARISRGYHFLSDCIAGLIIGLLSGFFSLFYCLGLVEWLLSLIG